MHTAARTWIPIVMLGVFLAALIWAVSFDPLPPADFTFCNDTEIKSVDPAIVSGQPEGRVIRALFEGLCDWDPETLEPIPGVARDWKISDDKLTYAFYLREEARWSDGSEVTADDFHWSFRRFLHPETAAEYAMEMWYVVGAKKYTEAKVEAGDPVEIELLEKPDGVLPFAEGSMLYGTLLDIEQPDDLEDTNPIYVVQIDGEQEPRRFQQEASEDSGHEDYAWLLYDFRQVGIRVVNRRTLEIRLKHPVPYFLNLMGFYTMFPVNRRCVETHGYPEWTKPENLVSNGPFNLQLRRIRDRIRLVKSDTYWDRDKVYLNIVDVLAVPAVTTQVNLYLTGKVDWVPTVPAEILPEMLARDQNDLELSPYIATYYYVINVTREPVNDARVRRALNLAMNKREIVQTITRAGQLPARSMVPPEMSKYFRKFDYTPAQCGEYNVEKARELLAEAGYPGGEGFPKIEIFYNTMESHKAIAELIQSQWKQALGIDVGLQNQEWSTYLNSRRLGKFDVARAGWIGDYIDPNTFLDLFSSDNPQNHSRWKNPHYDELLEKARMETDDRKRLQYYHDAERLLMDEMPVIPVYFYVSTELVRPYVKGFHRNLLVTHPLKGIRVDKAQKARLLEEEGLH